MRTGEAEDEDGTRRRIEFEFPLLTLRVYRFTKLYDWLGACRASRPISWAVLVGMPIVASFGLFLISTSIFILLTTPEAREAGRQLGPQAYILLPGVNPYLPILYGWVGIIAAIMVHEGAHGVIARSLGFRVKSSGLLFFLVIPIGAFVDVDEEQLDEAEPKNSARVMAGGPGANVALALICIFGILIITSGLSPLVDGLYINTVLEGRPAENAGLLAGDVIVMVDDQPVLTIDGFRSALEDKSPGDVVQVTVARGEMFRNKVSVSVELAEYEGRAVLGVVIGELQTEERLMIYNRLAVESPLIHFQPPTLAHIPFSEVVSGFYVHPLGSHWDVLANVFFWIWFVNINVAIFNALPIHPLDGGRAFRALLKFLLGKRDDEKTVSRLTNMVTVAMVSALVTMIVLPYVM